jgi:toluene monooxygenase system ferredoxin subunit
VTTREQSEVWHDVMPLSELWVGELVGVEVAGHDVLLANVGGEVRAFEDRCPHLSTPLSDGMLDGNVLMCSAHLWEFDCLTGKGINPTSCGLSAYAVRVEDGTIQVGVADA